MNWCEVVQRIADAMQGQAAARNVQLTVRIPQTPLAIDADAIRIEQIVWNLLSNALKFTPAGGHVELSLRATGQHFAMLEVKDSGKGISAEFLPYVFDIFEQGHRASIQGGGLGIGLSLVKQFTMLHGGQVRAYSNGEGQGARFTITLPLRKDSVVLPADSIERGTDTLSGLTLLFVDDDTETVEAFSALLEAEGASVIVATTGDEALRLVSAHEIDVVLSDLGLPGIDGFELLRRIKAQPRFAALPAVALSGYAGESESKRAREAGFAVHLNKPIILDSLVQTICTLLGRR
jgi:two-component system CheB/CheR fusion protein